MTWFTPDFEKFFIDLSRNNHKDWFDLNRKRYETSVKKPFLEFTTEVLERMKKLDKTITMQPKDALFRINKDVRFSKDKAPYKLHAAASISNTHKKDFENPGLYFQLSAEGIGIAGGLYQLEKNSLAAVREYIAGHLKEFDKLLADENFAEAFGGIQGEKNKIIDKALKPAAEKQPLLYNKQFYYWAEYPDTALLLDDNLPEFLVQHYQDSEKMNKFFRKALNR